MHLPNLLIPNYSLIQFHVTISIINNVGGVLVLVESFIFSMACCVYNIADNL